MDKTVYRRPALETLEDRLPPGSLCSGGDFWSHFNQENNLLSRVVQYIRDHRNDDHDDGDDRDDDDRRVRVLRPESFFGRPLRHFGQTYGEWSAAWWQWASSIPVDESPLFNNGDVTVGQSGKVWFLSGTFVSTTSEVGEDLFVDATDIRTETIPTGKALFFPIVNAEQSAFEAGIEVNPETGPTPEQQAQLQQDAELFADTIVPESLYVTINGRSLNIQDQFRVQSPSVFEIELPEDNFLGAPAGTDYAFADGYFVMLAPLPEGEHTLQWGGRAEIPLLDPEGNPTGGTLFFTLDVTYNLTVDDDFGDDNGDDGDDD